MKKAYITPEVEAHAICVETLIAASPDVTINRNGSVDAGSVETKGYHDKNVWDNQW